MSNQLLVFVTAMTPVLELRAAIPLGLSMGLPIAETFILSVVGNLLPVPFLILFSRPVIKWFKRFKIFERILSRIEMNATKKAHSIRKYIALGVFLFVAIPLPGTGAWTGSLVSALLDLRLKFAVPIILAGIIAAGIIVSLLSTGVIHIFS